MDRRSWLWRRKSSEKSPSGETESSGSVSSHSERFSDDQTVSNHNTQSPEVTSKASAGNELSDSEKSLSEKLSEALLNIRAKEDLVKQHAKVAEEAVSGWERAENEVLVLKKQNDSLTEKNSILEERVGHLDGALKECLRELRQAREEQQDKIYEAISKKSSQWESKKSDRENQLLEFQSKLEAAEKENSILKLELDFSTHAAETASKQHLDSIRKVAKLEAECRKLKAVARKASSVYVESCTDSQSDNLESESCKLELVDSERILGRSLIAPSVEIDLMDDFLEMERIASLPETKQVDGGETCLRDELKVMINRTTELEENLRKVTLEKESLEIALCEETHLQDELESMINRTTELEKNLMKVTAEKENLVIALSCGEARTVELEENLRKITAENESLEIALNKCQIQLKASEDKLEKTEKELESTKIKLTDLSELLHEAEVNLVEIQDQLTEANEAKSIFQLQLNDANLKKAEAESKLKVMELELETLQSRIRNLEKEFEKERNFSKETVAKSKVLESEISKMKSDSQFRRSTIVEEFRINQDKELAIAADKFAECQKTIASLDRQLKSLATLDDFLIESEFS